MAVRISHSAWMAIALLTIGTSLIGDGLARASAGIDRGAETE